MDPHTENSLIANSGLHFKTRYVSFNPEEPLLLPNGRTLRYTFLETFDFNNDCRIRVDLCSPKDGEFVPVNYMMENRLYEELPNGSIALDDSGVPKVKPDTVMTLVEKYPGDSEELMNINSLASYRIKNGHETNTAFNLLLGKWLPMPMFEREINGQSADYPMGWCRVKIDPVSERKPNGQQDFRITWAFDTTLGNDTFEGILRPTFLEGSNEKKEYALCNRADLLFGGFLNIPDGQNDAPIGDYLVSLLGIDLAKDEMHKYKFIGFYVYLINFLRMFPGAAPAITLYNKTSKQIPVDLSVDIGNSRTCCVLFENGDFTKARMLRLRDLSEPWRAYSDAFDMRIVFRRADFGGDLTQGNDLFRWPSLVRVGEEAKHLVYRSLEGSAESERTTNYSSPKRYLWDNQPYDSRWELMVVDGDPTNLRVNPHIFIEGFTDHFDDDGTFMENPKEIDIADMGNNDNQCHYSRRSLMTFVMIEMLQQALGYINSSEFRDWHGNIDCRRYLRSIIVTCPTAMPLQEQYVLRKAALDASRLVNALNPAQPLIKVTPDPEKLKPTDDLEKLEKRGWLYDEAFASQLVYLFAEAVDTYNGDVDKFFNLKGHVRKDMADLGFEGKAVTIGTIDIGAGTTDVMITAYGKKGLGRLTPVPLYYDSFHTAGDDIIRRAIQDIILEGPDNNSEMLGSISSALHTRIQRMTPDELLEIPRVRETREYAAIVEDIRLAISDDEVKVLKRHLANDLMHHFFADDMANQSHKDRRCRLDFCTQVTVPMAQYFLELLKQHRPPKNYTFDEFFPNEKPATFLLEHFAYHFGFRFEELEWRFDPEAVGVVIREAMESLIKALSVVIYAYHCDILVLSGRPTNLTPLTELLLKYIPIAPNRLVLLNQYRVGTWFPLATPEGYFKENQKAIVAVGAEVGLMASTHGYKGLVLDFSSLAKTMKSTARYIGFYDDDLKEVHAPFLTPENSTAILNGVSVFPCIIGCKQFNSEKYPARPLYAIYNHSKSAQLNIMLQRNYFEDRELITVEDVTDLNRDTISIKSIDLHMQTLAGDGSFWMDKGAFTLKIQEL